MLLTAEDLTTLTYAMVAQTRRERGRGGAREGLESSARACFPAQELVLARNCHFRRAVESYQRRKSTQNRFRCLIRGNLPAPSLPPSAPALPQVPKNIPPHWHVHWYYFLTARFNIYAN